ncbi:carbonic anhydrase [Sistotremastrum niveocremeum HHB9708]|uniref:Carbonic anhydrase n=1 Tax=Sistotremastrum niveocremeum HHB9708 TaxID=1314777 RepID=A0A164R8D1_9AGAM|nr:carbonic anhydrase [Sistotremastrum niveocremeum HHB9708]
MSAEHSTFPNANNKYVESFGSKGSLPLPPARKLAVVTCMDARIDPAASLGIHEGDAHIIRNAGGIAKDALRNIIISQRLLGTREIALFHHTDCGMLTFTTPQLQDQLKEAHPEHSTEISGIEFHPFGDLEAAVKSDVEFLKNHPLVLKETVITGWIYEVETGKVRQVV